MDNSEPDKRALELIRKTEEAIAIRQAEAERKARAILEDAKAQASAILRQKEEELAQTRERLEIQVFGVERERPHKPSQADLDEPTRRKAESIGRSLFFLLTGQGGGQE